MKILSDLFDLHRRAKKDSVGHMLFEASLRAGGARFVLTLPLAGV